jgi:hypothetical protein
MKRMREGAHGVTPEETLGNLDELGTIVEDDRIRCGSPTAQSHRDTGSDYEAEIDPPDSP